MSTPQPYADMMARKKESELLAICEASNDWPPEMLEAAKIELAARRREIPAALTTLARFHWLYGAILAIFLIVIFTHQEQTPELLAQIFIGFLCLACIGLFVTGVLFISGKPASIIMGWIFVPLVMLVFPIGTIIGLPALLKLIRLRGVSIPDALQAAEVSVTTPSTADSSTTSQVAFSGFQQTQAPSVATPSKEGQSDKRAEAKWRLEYGCAIGGAIAFCALSYFTGVVPGGFIGGAIGGALGAVVGMIISSLRRKSQ